jgi:hypothetical protein
MLLESTRKTTDEKDASIYKKANLDKQWRL